jgi:two-component system LytT family sensor kinase
MMRLNFHSSLQMYWLILVVLVALDYQRELKDRELRAIQLQGRLTAARLDALRMQLNPHFLFNALNSISSLMYVDADAADTMIRKLGELLKLSLDQRRGDEISLREELDFLQHYLDIERLRFAQRLRVRFDVEPEALAAMVPTFVLQPLVENALRHAIAPRPEGGTVEISVRRDDGWLRIVVADDGPGLPEGRLAEGVGLSNTRERLNQLYSLADALRLTAPEEGGLRVDVTVPFHTASDGPLSPDAPQFRRPFRP